MIIEAMINEINDEEFLVLEYFYNRIQTAIDLKKNSMKSIYTLFIKANFNKNFRELRSSLGFLPVQFDKKIASALIEKKLILNPVNTEQYTLTGLGIFIYELKTGRLNLLNLFQYLEKYFDFSSEAEKKLTDDEKIILFIMLLLRSFSETTPISIKSTNFLRVLDETVKISIDNLNNFNCLKKKVEYDTFYYKKKNENYSTDYGPLEQEYALYEAFHNKTRDLPKKINSLFISAGDKKYYLDLIDENQDVKYDDINYLILRLFDDVKPDFSILEQILNIMESVSFEKSTLIIGSNPYVSPEYTSKIRDKILFNI